MRERIIAYAYAATSPPN